jgi:predicted amidohydrolase YtcJ
MTIGGNRVARGSELVLVNGKIRTPAHPSGFTQAAAVSGGAIQALRSDDEIRDFIGPFTRVVDLRGRLVIPAFGDAHVHPVQGGLESMRCDLVNLKGRQEYLAAIAAYCQALPPGGWVLGGGWSMPAFPGGTPTAADLDAVTGGRPAFLPNRDSSGGIMMTGRRIAREHTAPAGDPVAGVCCI